MIARPPASNPALEIWTKLAASLPPSVISWRQDGKAVQRDGKYVARFVAYIDANTVRERLDTVVPGEWDLTLELLPGAPTSDDGDTTISFKARLQIHGVIREDVGTGRDYKSAATDAFKRAAVRFGVGHELYDFDQNWVQVDGDSKYAKPVEDPGAAYARRQARTNNGGGAQAPASQNGSSEARSRAAAPQQQQEPEPKPFGMQLDDPPCPKCGGHMWDNRLSKRNPKAPDFKCKNRSCDGAVWPPKEDRRASAGASKEKRDTSIGELPGEYDDGPPPLDDDDLIPF